MSSPAMENEVNATTARGSAAEGKRAPVVIPIRPGFSCTIRAASNVDQPQRRLTHMIHLQNTNTFYYSKTPIVLLDAQGVEIARKTFAAQGVSSVVVPMKIVSSGAYEWTFNAAPTARSINVDILHGVTEKGPFEQSKVAKPIQVRRIQPFSLSTKRRYSAWNCRSRRSRRTGRSTKSSTSRLYARPASPLFG